MFFVAGVLSVLWPVSRMPSVQEQGWRISLYAHKLVTYTHTPYSHTHSYIHTHTPSNSSPVRNTHTLFNSPPVHNTHTPSNTSPALKQTHTHKYTHKHQSWAYGVQSNSYTSLALYTSTLSREGPGLAFPSGTVNHARCQTGDWSTRVCPC